MTSKDYWFQQIDKATHFASLDATIAPDPQIVAALLVAHQLRDLNTTLDQIRAQLNQIEDQLDQD